MTAPSLRIRKLRERLTALVARIDSLNKEKDGIDTTTDDPDANLEALQRKAVLADQITATESSVQAVQYQLTGAEKAIANKKLQKEIARHNKQCADLRTLISKRNAAMKSTVALDEEIWKTIQKLEASRPPGGDATPLANYMGPPLARTILQIPGKGFLPE